MTTIGTVKSPGLNVRARPALHAKKLDALGRGDEVEILDRAAPYGYAWLKVKARKSGVESGVTGWVYAADVDIAPPAPPDVTPCEPPPEPPPPVRPPAPELTAPARAPRGFVFAAVALAAGIALLAWMMG